MKEELLQPWTTAGERKVPVNGGLAGHLVELLKRSRAERKGGGLLQLRGAGE